MTGYSAAKRRREDRSPREASSEAIRHGGDAPNVVPAGDHEYELCRPGHVRKLACGDLPDRRRWKGRIDQDTSGRTAANRAASRGANPSLAGRAVPHLKARLSPKTTIRNTPVGIGRARATGVPIDCHHTPSRPASDSTSTIVTPTPKWMISAATGTPNCPGETAALITAAMAAARYIQANASSFVRTLVNAADYEVAEWEGTEMGAAAAFAFIGDCIATLTLAQWAGLAAAISVGALTIVAAYQCYREALS